MRIVTRGDLDGLTGAIICSLYEQISSVELIHPQDVTAGRAEIRSGDILINVPYHPACSMWFDHHQHSAAARRPPEGFKGSYGLAPSAARLVYEYYGGESAMPELAELVHETDRLDSADLALADVTDPKGYILVGLTIDSRTGLGAFKTYFTILYELLRRKVDIEKVLAHPVVARRVGEMRSHETAFKGALQRHSAVHGNVVVTDFRPLAKAPVGNRFLVYALYPAANVSIRLHWGPGRTSVVAALGHSLFNRTCRTNLGALAAQHGGGGHRGAASIPIEPPEKADERLAQLLAVLKRG